MLKRCIMGLAIIAALAPLPAFGQAAPVKVLTTAATTNCSSVKTGLVWLETLHAGNSTATQYFLKLYNKATAPVALTDVPVWTIPLPINGAPVSPSIGSAIQFGLGLGVCITGGIADNDNTVSAAGVAVDFGITGR